MKITYQEALKRHPCQVATILGAKSKTKSPYKDMDPNQMVWEYKVDVNSELAQALIFDALDGIKREKSEIDLKWECLIKERPLDDQVRYYLKDMIISLRGKAGTWTNKASVEGPIPPEIIQIYRYIVDPNLRIKESQNKLNTFLNNNWK